MSARVMEIPITSWPGAFRLQLVLDASTFLDRRGSEQTLEGMVLRDWRFIDDFTGVRERFAAYVFGAVRQNGEQLVFIWNPVRTPEQRLTPVQSFTRTRQKDWPAVLHAARLIEDIQLAGGGDKNKVVTDRRWYDHGQAVATKVLTEIFVSPTPWLDSELETNEPMPTEVRGVFYGLPLDLGPCLHPLLELTDKLSGQAKRIDLSASARGLTLLGDSRSLAPTNHLRWQDHCFFDDQEQDECGLWVRTRLTAIAPAMPRHYA